MTAIAISELTEDRFDAALPALAGILHACVHAGASVGFVLPFAREDAAAFWRDRVFAALRGGGARLFVAEVGGGPVGTVMLGLGQPPNQPHRADVAKMLVHPDHRRRGIARALLRRLEAEAAALGKTLLVLDTRSGDPSQRLYQSEGYCVAGQIPGYCRNPFHDVVEPTTYMYKPLA